MEITRSSIDTHRGTFTGDESGSPVTWGAHVTDEQYAA
jgi:hypothetical protein